MKEFKSLGSKVETPSSPNKSILETFKNPGIGRVVFITQEFTSKCPVTGQPDFAKVAIEYRPGKLCLESKSLKLYLQSFREEKAFIEELTCRIADDINYTIKPNFITVQISSEPRGGISLEAEKSYYSGESNEA